MTAKAQKPSCIWCSTDDKGEPKRDADNKPPKRARLPETEPRFCSVHCALEFAYAYAANSAFPWKQTWCETHSCWYDDNEHADDGRCAECQAVEDYESAISEAEEQGDTSLVQLLKKAGPT